MNFEENYPVLKSADLVKLTEEFGSPLYVYHAETIKRQYERITNAFSNVSLKIKYACKALTNVQVLKYVHSLGAGLDAVSIEEAIIGIKAGFTPKEILLHQTV